MKQNSNRQPQRRQSASNRRTATERQRRQNTAQAKRAAAQRRKASAQRRKTSGRRRTQSSMRQRRTITIIAAVALALIAIILLVIGLRSCGSLDKKTDTAKEDTAVVQQDGRVTGKPAKATILSSGDYLIHKMILDSVRTGNGYDFDSIFTNVKDEITAADYAVCNFEFTITETGNFSFYPHFKPPPETADALKNAGFDFLVTANNHSGDDREDGIYRTVKILRQKGFKTTGTFETPDEKKYSVVDVNGIKVGIVNYTFGTIEQLYSELEQITADMKKDGAEAYIAYMHWGNEFQLQQTTTQQEIAQKLCDLGYNAIIGGHPHVIQPAAVLTGSNGNKTFCIYSTGNMVSNQRREYMSASPNGYTEDEVDNIYWDQSFGSKKDLDRLPRLQREWADVNYGPWNRTDGLVAEGFSAWNS